MAAARSLVRFPFPIHLGTDICQISRVRTILSHPFKAQRFVQRILSEEELQSHSAVIFGHSNRKETLCDQKPDNAAGSPLDPDAPAAEQKPGRAAEAALSRAAMFMAGRFAAKEAVIKAHPHRGLSFHQIVIAPRAPGSRAPRAIVRADGARFAQDQEALVSISHDGDYATAVCLGADLEPGEAQMGREGKEQTMKAAG